MQRPSGAAWPPFFLIGLLLATGSASAAVCGVFTFNGGCQTSDFFYSCDCIDNDGDNVGDTLTCSVTGGTSVFSLASGSSCTVGTLYSRNAGTCSSPTCQISSESTLQDTSGNFWCRVPDGTSTACGDPHFRGFTGEEWDFQGQFEATYSLFSSAHTGVNMRIVRRGSHLGGPKRGWHQLPSHKNVSTWIGGLAATYLHDSVVVEKLPDMSLLVEANGVAVPFDRPLQLPSGMMVHYRNLSYAAGGTNSQRFASDKNYMTPAVIIATPELTLHAELLPTFSRRLDLSASLNAPLAQLAGSYDGMLGGTIREVSPASPALSMEARYADVTWVYDKAEGERIRYSAALEAEFEAAYRTSGLLAHDAATNRYVPPTEPPPQRAEGETLTDVPATRGRAALECSTVAWPRPSAFVGVVHR